MELWASSLLGQYVNFICICVDDDKHVAIRFEQMFKFKKAINLVVMNRQDMPSYGQLGCSGFIVIGADGHCVSKKTNAFLDYGERAFQSAENVIKTALEDAGIDLDVVIQENERLYASGQILRLEGVSSDPTLNDSLVTVLNFNTSSGRFNVALNDGSNRKISVMPCCLAPVNEEVKTLAKDQPFTEIQPPNLIGCKEVDEEHVECTVAINNCLSSCTRENLTLLLSCLEQHFQHEEILASKSGFGSSTDAMSPMYSHAKDHERILQLARDELDRTATAKDLSTVSIDVVRLVGASFIKHATLFDSLLEGKL
jgi:hemerythrin